MSNKIIKIGLLLGTIIMYMVGIISTITPNNILQEYNLDLFVILSITYICAILFLTISINIFKVLGKFMLIPIIMNGIYLVLPIIVLFIIFIAIIFFGANH